MLDDVFISTNKHTKRRLVVYLFIIIFTNSYFCSNPYVTHLPKTSFIKVNFKSCIYRWQGLIPRFQMTLKVFIYYEHAQSYKQRMMNICVYVNLVCLQCGFLAFISIKYFLTWDWFCADGSYVASHFLSLISVITLMLTNYYKDHF